MLSAETWGSFLCGNAEIQTYREKDFCILFPLTPNEQEIRLSSKANGYGGAQMFFLCPTCGKRVRFLYICRDHLFKCRVCARLNYQSQQQSRGDMYYFEKGVDFAKRHLVPEQVDGFSFTDWIPDRPRYQHETTYRRNLRRLAKYQERHTDQQMQSLMRILSKCSGKGRRKDR